MFESKRFKRDSQTLLREFEPSTGSNVGVWRLQLSVFRMTIPNPQVAFGFTLHSDELPLEYCERPLLTLQADENDSLELRGKVSPGSLRDRLYSLCEYGDKEPTYGVKRCSPDYNLRIHPGEPFKGSDRVAEGTYNGFGCVLDCMEDPSLALHLPCPWERLQALAHFLRESPGSELCVAAILPCFTLDTFAPLNGEEPQDMIVNDGFRCFLHSVEAIYPAEEELK